MARILVNSKKVMVVVVSIVSIVLMSACNNQVCPAYSKVTKPEIQKSV